jgi:hypothetical protein
MSEQEDFCFLRGEIPTFNCETLSNGIKMRMGNLGGQITVPVLPSPSEECCGRWIAGIVRRRLRGASR